VLIDETNRARLADFGSSSIIGDLPEALTYLQWSTPCAGTVRWAAPEQLQLADGEMFKVTTKSDVYSFGCIMLQAGFYVVSEDVGRIEH
jgi:serine/threonine protein kinase